MSTREIIFRALKDDISNCNFVYGDLIYNSNGEPQIKTGFDGDKPLFTTCIKGTEGQFTGWVDVNNVRIFEGDIVNIGNNILGFVKNNNDKVVEYEVKCDGCDYILYREDLGLNWGRLSGLDEMGWICKVVGNIHENKSPLYKEAKHLKWIHDRIVNVYGENENNDFLIKMREIIEKLK